jgi:hypothetical protein
MHFIKSTILRVRVKIQNLKFKIQSSILFYFFIVIIYRQKIRTLRYLYRKIQEITIPVSCDTGIAKSVFFGGLCREI